MRVLVSESAPGAGDDAVHHLEASGHTVVRCFERDEPAFPCRGMSGTSTCPLDEAPVDVALDIRATPGSQRHAREDGIKCALRQRIPLVVAGRSLLGPFNPWAVEEVDGHDVVGAVEAAARARSEHHSAVATKALHRVLGQFGQEVGGSSAVVRRDGGGLRVDVVSDGDDEVRHAARLAVLAALREYDRYALKISIDEVSQPRS